MTGTNTRCAPAVATLLLLAAAALPAYATAQENAGQHGQPGAKADSAGLSDAEIEVLFWARQDSARMRFTAADVAFMTGMISHHAQAIVMSEMAPSHGASPTVQTLAARIINSQRDEIARMQRWLELRGQPVPQVSEGGHMEGHEMGGHEMAGHSMDGHSMPGMLTPEQLDELHNAFGTDFDYLYLKYMIQHHGGALVMVDDLISVDGAAQDRAAFKLASDIQADQVTEIERMTQLLERMSSILSDTREESR